MVQLSSLISELIKNMLFFEAYTLSYLFLFLLNHKTPFIFLNRESWDGMNILPPPTGIFLKIIHWLTLLHTHTQIIILATSHIIIKTQKSFHVGILIQRCPSSIPARSSSLVHPKNSSATANTWVKLSLYLTHRRITLFISTWFMFWLEYLLHIILIICLQGCPVYLFYYWFTEGAYLLMPKRTNQFWTGSL